MVKDVKITVVSMLKPGKVFDELAADSVTAECGRVNIGDEFISKELNMPEEFCSWAWADIQRDVAHLALGGNFPWIKKEGSMVSCCTDGLRPVVFKLERVE
ncbi:MAG: TIGR04076 family protein [Candidatus Bathyarchaeia archaeon]